MAQAARLASRLQRELTMLHSDPPPGVSAWPSEDHLLTHLQAQIDGPQGTVYANGIFKLDIQVPERYPFEPPNIKFVTPVYHPNIDNGGRICLDILNLPPKGAWRPSLNISTLLASIGLLLAEPNPDDGLMGEITAEYKHDRSAFDCKARKWTELYASQDQVTTEVNMPEPSLCPESNQILAPVRSNIDQSLEVTTSKVPEDGIVKCASLLQPIRSGPSLSKRLALDRGTTCLQQNKAASLNVSHIHVNQVHHAVTSKEIVSPLTKASTDLQVQSCGKHNLKAPIFTTEEQLKNGLASEKLKLSSLDQKKVSLQIADQEQCCRNSSKGLFHEVAPGNSKADMEASLSSANLTGRAAALGKDFQLDGGSSPAVSMSASMQNSDVGKSSEGKELRKKPGDPKDIENVGKENRPPIRCPALEPGAGISSDLAAKKDRVENNPMELLGVFNSATAMNNTILEPGKEKAHFCLPSRTKSLKLARTKPDAQPFHSTMGQQNTQSLPVIKKWNSPPILIPDDIPTVVVSDSGSDSELSDEGFTLSLTQRSLANKRKAGSKLR